MALPYDGSATAAAGSTSGYQTTSSDVGRKVENLEPKINVITQWDKPFSKMIGKKNISNVVYQWVDLDLTGGKAFNAAAAGADISSFTKINGTRRDNITQILTVNAGVDGSEQNVDRAKYVSGNALAEQKALKTELLLQNIEYMHTGGHASQVYSASGTHVERDVWALTSQSTAGVIATGMTETLLNTMAVNVIKNGGATTNMTSTSKANGMMTLLITIEMLDKFNALLDVKANTYRSVVGANGMQGRSFASYAATGMNISLVPSLYSKANSALLFNPGNWDELVYRGLTWKPLATVGDSDRAFALTERSLYHANFKASQKFLAV